MEIIHISAECFPVAKAGGLGDVVGALPKYQNRIGHIAKVLMPMYRTPFLYQNEWKVDYKGWMQMGDRSLEFTVIKEVTNKLGFDLYLLEIKGLTDREHIYGYPDDIDRFIAFQIAALCWICQWEHRPDIIHCHDHHTGLIPFMIKNCYQFKNLALVRTVFTIHNGQYQGWMGWDKAASLPSWDRWKWGDLDWQHSINSLAAGIRCAWTVTTVSNTYLYELRQGCKGLEPLFEYEKGKCHGILNGIDFDVWDPSHDHYLNHHYKAASVTLGKKRVKAQLCEQYELNNEVPLIVFISRLVWEKAADVLPDAFWRCLDRFRGQVSFLLLGSGEKEVEDRLRDINGHFPGFYHAEIGYSESLSHEMFAGADFLLMSSRVEPCGLNQLYALRYGTIPIVRRTGGLRDTVTDYGDPEGNGICFNNVNVEDIIYSVGRAIDLFHDRKKLLELRRHNMALDHSWERTVREYEDLYRSIL